MDRAVALWLLSMGVAALAFFAPFTLLRVRRVALRPATATLLAIVSAIVLLFALHEAPAIDGDSLALLVALGFVPLGMAAGARGGWRFVAPVGAALGIVVLALMAWGPFHPPVFTGPKAPPPPPPLPPRAWAMLLAGTALLGVPRPWAIGLAAALLWLALIVAGAHDARTSELLRAYYMAAPGFLALAALLSAAVTPRERRVSPPHGMRSHS